MVEDGFELQYAAGIDITSRLMQSAAEHDDNSRPILGGRRNYQY